MKVLSKIENNEDAITKKYVDDKAGVTAVDPTSGAVTTDFFIPTKTSDLTNDSGFITDAALTGKQDTLVSGTNIKTINNESLLGSGNLTISGGTATDVKINNTSITSNGVANIVTNSAYNASSNKIATIADLPDTTDLVEKYAGNNLWDYYIDNCFYESYPNITAINQNNEHRYAYIKVIGDDSEDNNEDNNASIELGVCVPIGATGGGEIIHGIYIDSNGTSIDGASVTISNLQTPISNTDAANKKYVDDAIATAITSVLEASY